MRSAANLLKLFRWRLFCMVVLRFSAGKEHTSAGRSAPAEASTAAPHARRTFPCHSAPVANAIYQSNVIRTHTRQRKPSLEKGRPPARPPTQPPRNTHPAKERDLMAENNRLSARQEHRSTAGEEVRREAKFPQRRLNGIKASRTFHRIQKARDCRSVVTPHLCRQSVV